MNDMAEDSGSGGVSKEERTNGMLCHLLAIFLGVIGPLIIWLMKKEESEFVDYQGKEAINFQITIVIAFFVCGLLAPFLIGFLLMPIVGLVHLVFCVIATMKANEGVRYRYPFALRLIK